MAVIVFWTQQTVFQPVATVTADGSNNLRDDSRGNFNAADSRHRFTQIVEGPAEDQPNLGNEKA